MSQSSSKNHQFIELTTDTNIYDFSKDSVQCAWLIHEIGHELFNRSNSINTGLYNENINEQFSKFLMGDKEFQQVAQKPIKDPNGLEYYGYPDSYANQKGVFSEKDAYYERIACYHQYKFLTDNDGTSEKHLKFLEDSYTKTSGYSDYKKIYFKKWFEFFGKK